MAYTQLDGKKLQESLVGELSEVADDIRDLAVEFGLRPYTVHIIRTRWSGGRRHVGQELIVSETPILPTPEVMNIGTLDEELSPVGGNEVGLVRLMGVSMQYTENFLRGLDENGTELDDAENVFYEIRYLRPEGEVLRRRFTLATVPSHRPGQLDWMVTLDRSKDDRFRNGET